MIWYIENLSRSRAERQAIEALAANVDWLVLGDWRIDASLRLILDAEIGVGDRRYAIALRYPNHFPHTPPLVLPRGEDERWSSHQYGPGGELCLEWGPDNWHHDLTGADMLQSAFRLLEGEGPVEGGRGQVASRHATTLGQDLRGDRMRLLVTPFLTEAAATVREGELIQGTIAGTYWGGSFAYIVSSVALADGQKRSDSMIPPAIVSEGLEKPVAFLRLPSDAELPTRKSRTEFCTALAAHGLVVPEVDYVVLVRRDRFHCYLLWNDTASVISVIPWQDPGRRLDEVHALLPDKKVCVVGCGSLGSKLAVSLARSGVGKFLLVDDDLMLPPNLVRNDLDWRDMGRHKVDAVAHRIGLVNPSAQCDARQYRLGGQHSSGSIESLIETIAECDLIIDASADARVFNYLCAAAGAGKKPLLWAEVFGGGFGGLIARSRPEFEPDPASVRAIIEQWCKEQGKPIPRAAIDYETRERDGPMVADDSDVSAIAAHAARLAIDTLARGKDSLFPYSAYMIGLSQGWIFEQPFDIRPIDMGGPIRVDRPEIDPQAAGEERARVLALFQKFADENSSPAADHSASGE